MRDQRLKGQTTMVLCSGVSRETESLFGRYENKVVKRQVCHGIEEMAGDGTRIFRRGRMEDFQKVRQPQAQCWECEDLNG